MRVFPQLLLSLLLAACAGHAQQPAAPSPVAFFAADIHPSPPVKFPYPDGGKLFGDRYILLQATLVDLIAHAYKLDPSRVLGGPSWLEMERFDVVAKTSPGTPDADVRTMLQVLLAERFGLIVHAATLPVPAYRLTVAASGLKMRPAADPGSSPSCQSRPSGNGNPAYTDVQCKNLTPEDLATRLQDMAGDYLDKPVVDQTGLTGKYDFELKWTERMRLGQQGSEGIPIFDAVEKLGLKLTLQTAPRPVLAIDRVNRTPAPNPPNTATLLPPSPPPHFDVATLRPSRPDEQPDGHVRDTFLDFKAIPLLQYLAIAFDLNPNDSEAIFNLPHGMAQDRYDAYAKIVVDPVSHADASPSPNVDLYLGPMLQALLVERFRIRFHYEDRPVSTYTLFAVKPQLRPAIPTSRTHCLEGAGANGIDPRLNNAKLNRLITCQNTTMAQLGQELQHIAPGYIFNPVKDETGLTGAYDFTLSFSSADLMGTSDTPKAAADSGQASDPDGALSLPDALRRQLGLKLEKTKRPARVLVIDHIDPKPAEES